MCAENIPKAEDKEDAKSEGFGGFEIKDWKAMKDGSVRFGEGRGGQPQLFISRQNLPGFLVESFEAVEAGRIEEGLGILDDERIAEISELVEKDKERIDVIFVIAKLFYSAGRVDKAGQWYRKLAERCEHPLVYNQLGNVCRHQGRLAEAIQYRRKALKLDPDNADYVANLGVLEVLTGEVHEGLGRIQEAIAKAPKEGRFHSCLLINLHYLSNLDMPLLFEEHKRFGKLYAPIANSRLFFDNTLDAARRLRVGYISPDFRMHSVMYFFEPLLENHDRRAVEVFGYGSVEVEDKVTGRLKSKFDHYRDIRRMADKVAANLIADDKVDILVDLSGHTAGNRLGVLAFKPAPIQVSYLGYPDTTGMEQVDYRLSDRIADPLQSQQFYSEELVYLPNGFLCYRPIDIDVPISKLPSAEKGYITFGSFNNSAKVNPLIAALWAEVLRQIEDSRLILKFNGGDDELVRGRVFDLFKKYGIEAKRVDIFGWKRLDEHLKLYNELDIGLDTYPYNGTTTTCEAAWMGVPTLSLTGKHHCSRVGRSMLSRLGLDFFSASTPKEYVSKACALAKDTKALAAIRASMRERMSRSGFCDGKRFAGQVESAYRQMWRRWCEAERACEESGEQVFSSD